MERSDLLQLEPLACTDEAMRVRQGELDGESHIGQSQLCQLRAVDKLHDRVDDTLRMNQNVNALVRSGEEPMGLNHFKTLVHERRGINSDLASHPPRRMSQGVGCSHCPQGCGRCSAKRSAGCGENDALNWCLGDPACCLPDRAVLAIDGS